WTATACWRPSTAASESTRTKASRTTRAGRFPSSPAASRSPNCSKGCGPGPACKLPHRGSAPERTVCVVRALQPHGVGMQMDAAIWLRALFRKELAVRPALAHSGNPARALHLFPHGHERVFTESIGGATWPQHDPHFISPRKSDGL